MLNYPKRAEGEELVLSTITITPISGYMIEGPGGVTEATSLEHLTNILNDGNYAAATDEDKAAWAEWKERQNAD